MLAFDAVFIHRDLGKRNNLSSYNSNYTDFVPATFDSVVKIKKKKRKKQRRRKRNEKNGTFQFRFRMHSRLSRCYDCGANRVCIFTTFNDLKLAGLQRAREIGDAIAFAAAIFYTKSNKRHSMKRITQRFVTLSGVPAPDLFLLLTRIHATSFMNVSPSAERKISMIRIPHVFG